MSQVHSGIPIIPSYRQVPSRLDRDRAKRFRRITRPSPAGSLTMHRHPSDTAMLRPQPETPRGVLSLLL
jgi:hypothetical protein